MDAWIIILGVIIIIIAFFLIKYYFFTTTSLAEQVYLKSPPPDVSLNDSLNPRSILYTFGSWVYVNNFSNAVLYSYNSTTDNPKTQFALILGGVAISPGNVKGSKNSPVLTAIVNGNSSGANSIHTITITNNFPIQKWVHVLVSVDTIYADCYIDGKLVISSPLNPQITNSPSSTPLLSFYQPTGTKPDIYLTKVKRWANPLDPQSVWTEYSAGNGLSQGGNLAVALNITNDSGSKNYAIYSN
jgi:hypothetical protein